VRIRVRAAGVNFADTLMVGGRYQVKPPFPFTPGLEAAGEIIEAGAAVGNLRVGERVLAVLRAGGGYAEEIVLGAAAVVPIPAAMDFLTAAAFPVAYGTSHFALTHRGQLQAGETLLVLGAAGGVGLTAIEIGKAMGARIIAAASGVEKLDVARSRGADELIDYRTESIRDRVRALTDGKGADVVYDPVGGDAFDQALRAVNWEARMLVIGFAGGPHSGGARQSDPRQEHLGHRGGLGRAGRARSRADQPQPCRIAALVGGRPPQTVGSEGLSAGRGGCRDERSAVAPICRQDRPRNLEQPFARLHQFGPEARLGHGN
jgi:NADPH:quinone reductase-like Zn-dependent oxidoreductase